MSTVHIHSPRTVAARRTLYCRTCGRVRRVVQLMQAYYDPMFRCPQCGENPYDEPRKYKKVTLARAGKIRRAKELYRRAKPWKAAMDELMKLF